MKIVCNALLAIVLSCLPIAVGFAHATSISLPRAIYWDVSHAYIPKGYSSRTHYFVTLGITEVHIWLNDNEWDADHGSRCQPFTYTDSHGAVRWTRQSLIAFVRELKAAGITPIFTLSPQVQSLEYVASLLGPDGPLTIAREESVPAIELDLEGNWRTDRLMAPCGKGDIGKVDQALVDAIHDADRPAGQRQPLTLIVSTTAWKEKANRALVLAADALAPQLYEAKYGYSAKTLQAEMKSTWLPYKKPMTAALNLGCHGPDVGIRCSREMFEASLRAVASLAHCGPKGTRIGAYVLWSESTVARLSSFGKAWLAETKEQPIPTTCSN